MIEQISKLQKCITTPLLVMLFTVMTMIGVSANNVWAACNSVGTLSHTPDTGLLIGDSSVATYIFEAGELNSNDDTLNVSSAIYAMDCFDGFPPGGDLDDCSNDGVAVEYLGDTNLVQDLAISCDFRVCRGGGWPSASEFSCAGLGETLCTALAGGFPGIACVDTDPGGTFDSIDVQSNLVAGGTSIPATDSSVLSCDGDTDTNDDDCLAGTANVTVCGDSSLGLCQLDPDKANKITFTILADGTNPGPVELPEHTQCTINFGVEVNDFPAPDAFSSTVIENGADFTGSCEDNPSLAASAFSSDDLEVLECDVNLTKCVQVNIDDDDNLDEEFCFTNEKACEVDGASCTGDGAGTCDQDLCVDDFCTLGGNECTDGGDCTVSNQCLPYAGLGNAALGIALGLSEPPKQVQWRVKAWNAGDSLLEECHIEDPALSGIHADLGSSISDFDLVGGTMQEFVINQTVDLCTGADTPANNKKVCVLESPEADEILEDDCTTDNGSCVPNNLYCPDGGFSNTATVTCDRCGERDLATCSVFPESCADTPCVDVGTCGGTDSPCRGNDDCVGIGNETCENITTEQTCNDSRVTDTASAEVECRTCSVELVKEVSCDSGASFGESCTGWSPFICSDGSTTCTEECINCCGEADGFDCVVNADIEDEIQFKYTATNPLGDDRVDVGDCRLVDMNPNLTGVTVAGGPVDLDLDVGESQMFTMPGTGFAACEIPGTNTAMLECACRTTEFGQEINSVIADTRFGEAADGLDPDSAGTCAVKATDQARLICQNVGLDVQKICEQGTICLSDDPAENGKKCVLADAGLLDVCEGTGDDQPNDTCSMTGRTCNLGIDESACDNNEINEADCVADDGTPGECAEGAHAIWIDVSNTGVTQEICTGGAYNGRACDDSPVTEGICETGGSVCVVPEENTGNCADGAAVTACENAGGSCTVGTDCIIPAQNLGVCVAEKSEVDCDTDGGSCVDLGGGTCEVVDATLENCTVTDILLTGECSTSGGTCSTNEDCNVELCNDGIDDGLICVTESPVATVSTLCSGGASCADPTPGEVCGEILATETGVGPLEPGDDPASLHFGTGMIEQTTMNKAIAVCEVDGSVDPATCQDFACGASVDGTDVDGVTCDSVEDVGTTCRVAGSCDDDAGRCIAVDGGGDLGPCAPDALLDDACGPSIARCEADVCDQKTTMFMRNTECEVEEGGCFPHTPGYWGTHHHITQAVINTAGGTCEDGGAVCDPNKPSDEVCDSGNDGPCNPNGLFNCGIAITDSTANVEGSAIEDMCSVGKDSKDNSVPPQLVQLERQCMAAILGVEGSKQLGGDCDAESGQIAICVDGDSVIDGDCEGVTFPSSVACGDGGTCTPLSETTFLSIEDTLDNCCLLGNSVCTNGTASSISDMTSCIGILDAFNNSDVTIEDNFQCDGATDQGTYPDGKECEDSDDCGDGQCVNNNGYCPNTFLNTPGGDMTCSAWPSECQDAKNNGFLNRHGGPPDVCTPSDEIVGVGNTCSDGLDNDCDGKIDSSDPSCKICNRNMKPEGCTPAP